MSKRVKANGYEPSKLRAGSVVHRQLVGIRAIIKNKTYHPRNPYSPPKNKKTVFIMEWALSQTYKTRHKQSAKRLQRHKNLTLFYNWRQLVTKMLSSTKLHSGSSEPEQVLSLSMSPRAQCKQESCLNQSSSSPTWSIWPKSSSVPSLGGICSPRPLSAKSC